MNLLSVVQQWRDQRDAIPTEKIKVLGLVSDMASVRRQRVAAAVPSPESRPTKPLSTERAEHRINITGVAMLIGRHGRLGVEQATMQDVSSRGVRVVSGSEWYVDDTILVSLPAGHFTSAARVAYCDAVAEGRFAVGLQFVGSSQSLDLSAFGRQ